MADPIRLGLGRRMIPIPGWLWRRLVRVNASRTRRTLRFMSADHHRVRDLAVDYLFRTGVPLSPDEIARSLNLPPPRVNAIIEELERHLTFLYRSAGPDVTWAYPVTVDRTPHRAVAASGEQAYSP